MPSIRKNIIWNACGNLVYLVVQWLLTYVVVLSLGFEKAGVFSLAMSVCGSLFCLAAYNMRHFQTSDVKDLFNSRTYLASRYVTTVLAVLVCLVFVLIMGYSALVGACVVAYMFFKASESLSDVYQGMLQRRMRLDLVGVSFLLKAFLILVVFGAFVFLTGDLLIPIIGMSVASFLVVYVFDRKKAEAVSGFGATQKASGAEIKKLLVACLPLAVFGFLFNTMGFAPRLFVEAQLGAEALGIYSSVAMPTLIIQVSASYIFAPLVTPFAEYLEKGDMKSFGNLFKKTSLFLMALALVSLVGFFFLGDWLLVLLFGEKIIAHTYLMMPLVVCTILVAVSWFLSAVIVITRKLIALLIMSAISFLIVICGSTFFIENAGMNGASFVYILALSVFIIGCIVILARELIMKGAIKAKDS